MSKFTLGIELGSTRIKSVLIDEKANVIAQGEHDWENQYENGYWTYSLDDVWNGLSDSYGKLNEDYKRKFGENIKELSCIGISAMMHGYLAFDESENLLVPFRTWRNTTTSKASAELSELFKFNMPQRWSTAHYYQAVLDGEEHVKEVKFLTTLAGYVHYKLTGKRVIGVGDASGMFPLDNKKYNPVMLDKFNTLLKSKGIDINYEDLLPKILVAGEKAGELTEEGAKLLDKTGNLKAGIMLCPPEGDGETGMTATNSIAPKTANVSAGTSGFLMVVLEKNLENYYEEIDIIATPEGNNVAMVHVNNFTSEINAWTNLFDDVLKLAGVEISKGELFEKLFKVSAKSGKDVGKLMGYNFLSGEHIVHIERGIPLVLRQPEGEMNIANFMQMQIYSALASLSIGMEILKKEDVKINAVCGHGGFFKTDFIGQNAMSSAVGAPVTVMNNAGEGGAWGIALLALFTASEEKALDVFLNKIFENTSKSTVMADAEEIAKFDGFMKLYKQGLVIEKTASENL